MTVDHTYSETTTFYFSQCYCVRSNPSNSFRSMIPTDDSIRLVFFKEADFEGLENSELPDLDVMPGMYTVLLSMMDKRFLPHLPDGTAEIRIVGLVWLGPTADLEDHNNGYKVHINGKGRTIPAALCLEVTDGSGKTSEIFHEIRAKWTGSQRYKRVVDKMRTLYATGASHSQLVFVFEQEINLLSLQSARTGKAGEKDVRVSLYFLRNDRVPISINDRLGV